jgi:hypothetical protein
MEIIRRVGSDESRVMTISITSNDPSDKSVTTIGVYAKQ